MFGKRELVDSLNRDLVRARNKRDALASGLARLTAHIGELEVRLSAENERLDRERAANEIAQIKKVVRDRSLAFSAAIAGFRKATEAAETIVPDARKLSELLDVTATEVAKGIDGLLSELHLRIEAVLAGNAAPPQISDHVRLVPEKPTKVESDEDRSSTAAA
jgi:hypothetical protein